MNTYHFYLKNSFNYPIKFINILKVNINTKSNIFQIIWLANVYLGFINLKCTKLWKFVAEKSVLKFSSEHYCFYLYLCVWGRDGICVRVFMSMWIMCTCTCRCMWVPVEDLRHLQITAQVLWATGSRYCDLNPALHDCALSHWNTCSEVVSPTLGQFNSISWG